MFEIFDGDPSDVSALKLQTQTNFEKGPLHYHSREFEMAKQYFETVISQNPNDLAARLYHKRTVHFSQYGVPPDWEWVESLTEM